MKNLSNMAGALVQIKEAQEQLGWTNYRLAKELGIAEGTLKGYLSGKNIPSINRFVQLCEAVGLALFITKKDTNDQN